MSDFEKGKFILIHDKNHPEFSGVYLIKNEIKTPIPKSNDKWFYIENTETLEGAELPLSYLKEYGKIY